MNEKIKDLLDRLYKSRFRSGFHLKDKDKKYKDIREREYKCSVCENKQSRDINASINIMYEGMKLYIKEKYSLV